MPMLIGMSGVKRLGPELDRSIIAKLRLAMVFPRPVLVYEDQLREWALLESRDSSERPEDPRFGD
jgi:hypothetical protein